MALIQRAGIFHLRVNTPSSLKCYLPAQQTIKLSLKTKDRRQASRFAQKCTDRLLMVCHLVRKHHRELQHLIPDHIPPAEFHRLVRQFVADGISPYGVAQVEDTASLVGLLQGHDDLIASTEQAIKVKDQTVRLRVLIDEVQQIMRDLGIKDSVGVKDSVGIQTQAPSSPPPPVQEPEVLPAGITLSQLIAEHSERQIKAGRWSLSTQLNYSVKLRALTAFLGEGRSIATITVWFR
jgi:hypothetical protein